MKAFWGRRIGKVVPAMAVLLWVGPTGGCIRKVEQAPERSMRKPEPGVSVQTYGNGPMRYQVLTTNQPDGAKRYRFVPAR